MLAAILAVSIIACAPAATVAPELELSASPSQIHRDGSTTQLTITATDEQGKPGVGDVSLESSVGSLSAGLTVPLDANGAATADFSCDIAADPGCFVDSVVVSVKWKRASAAVLGSLNVRIASDAPGTDGGAGSDLGSLRTCSGTFAIRTGADWTAFEQHRCERVTGNLMITPSTGDPALVDLLLVAVDGTVAVNSNTIVSSVKFGSLRVIR